MDEFLNELYGTSDTIGAGDDLEKNAAAEFLVKLAQEEGVDLNSLSDEEVGALLIEVEKSAAAGEFDDEDEDEDDEAQEKLAEADFLGRAMAHAYVNELSEIEKQAVSVAGAREAGSKAVGWVGKKLEQLGGAAAKRSKSVSGNIQGAGTKAYKAQVMKRMQQARGSGMKSGSKTGKRFMGAARKEGVAAGIKGMGLRQKLVGGGIAGTAALGGAGLGYGGYKALGGGKETRSFDESFESAAQERAYDILANAGYDVEKVAEQDVDVRALQMLEEAGYPVEWAE